MQRFFQSKFDFPICLDVPYKFCDFRAAYGEVFAEYLAGYDFWGHCDIDLLWGDIRAFVTDEVLTKYDRVYTHGHCCLYKNTACVNSWYRTLPANGYQEWKTVFSKLDACYFDKWGEHSGGGMSAIIQSNGIPYYDEPDMADLRPPNAHPFRHNGYFSSYTQADIKDKGLYFHYKEGKLFACYNNTTRECLYCHFQKRPIKIEEGYNPNDFYLLSPGRITSRSAAAKRDRAGELVLFANSFVRRVKRGVRRILKQLLLHRKPN